MKRHSGSSNTVRRSVALPRRLLESAQSSAPPEIRENVNRIVVVALSEYVERRQHEEFESQMTRMAQDPAIRAECNDIAAEFAGAETDGLSNREDSVTGRRGRG